MICYWKSRLGAAGWQTKGAWNSFHEYSAAATGKAGRLVMSHVPIATPPVWEVIAPSLAAHALQVDVNIIYMGAVTAGQDYEASIICCFFFYTSKEAHGNILLWYLRNWRSVFDSIQRLKRWSWHVHAIHHRELSAKFLTARLHPSRITERPPPALAGPLSTQSGVARRRCPKLCQTLRFVRDEPSFMWRPKGGGRRDSRGEEEA